MCAAPPESDGRRPSELDEDLVDAADGGGVDEVAAPPSVVSMATQAVQALEELVRCAWSECGQTDGLPQGAEFVLHWASTGSAQDLADQAFRRASELASDDLLFRLGHVYCYSCRSSECSHSSPPACGAVFAGYESTGRPRWQEFFNYLLELEDSRTDLLFASEPQMLARLVGRTRLVSEQLASFGKNSLTYRVWGQVVAGYIHIRGLRSAISVQLVEDRSRQLRLQVVADTATRDALANAPDSKRSALHRVYDALAEARRQISSLSSLWQHTRDRGKQKDIRDRAFSALRHLVHSIERKGRQHRRRTAHAELRGQQRRPVHKAYDDLTAAPRDAFYNDTVRHSIIVLGKSGRAHVFSDAGKHITSFLLQGDELDRRIGRKRYAPYPADQVEAFRSQALAAIPSER